MNPGYILRLTYNGGSIFFKGQSDTRRKYPGVKPYKTLPNALSAAKRIKIGTLLTEVSILEVSYKEVAILRAKELPEFPHGEFDNGKHWKGEG